MFNSSQKKQSAIAVLFAIFLFFGFIGTKQQLSLQPLGLFLEDNASLRKLGYLTTDGDPIYRVSGFTGHPTFFASFLSLLFPLGSGVLLWTYKHKHSKLLWISFASMILSGVAILSTQSRSGWVSISISTVYFLVLLIRAQEKRAIKFFLIGIAILLVTTITTTPTIINRLASIPNVFITGSGNVRILLIQQAFEMIYEHPFLGVGLNHFVRVMKSHDLPINLQGFMFPVHNTFLLFFSELGIPAGLAFLWFTISVMKQSMHRASKNWVTLGVWLGALTFFINAQFHTLFNQDPTFDVFMILLGFLSVI
jgi:O-antigen ligase